MVLTDRSNTNMFKKISLGTQFFIFFKLWLIGKQYYEIVSKFWLVNHEIETAPTYEKSHSAPHYRYLQLADQVENSLQDIKPKFDQ